MARVLASDVDRTTFRTALRGYTEKEVDEFLEEISAALRMWEQGRAPRLTAFDVQRQTFRTALRGYAEEEVDVFLDRVVETLEAYARQPVEAELPDELDASETTDRSDERPEARKRGARSSEELLEQTKRWLDRGDDSDA
ncbi:MAG: DivIVA domain-containing protein [Acidimicrobiia bacterium]